MASKQPEEAFEALKANLSTIKAAQGSNESTTRLRAIDTILFDVLDWDQRVVLCEEYVRTAGYADYAFMSGQSITLILEAKKSGKTFFVAPVKSRPGKPVGFSLLAKESKDARDALLQAVGYAASKGTRYVGITNGSQWLLTLTYVQQQPVEERSVFVFDSLEYIQENFRLFWDCFSRNGIESNRAADSLIEIRKAPAPDKASLYITNYPVAAARNPISNELTTVIGSVWEEMRNDEENPEFLIECYIEPDSNATSLAVAQQLVQRRLSQDEHIRLKPLTPDSATNDLKSLDSVKPIIVLGKIGHGKTTFLRYLRHVKANRLLNKYIQIDIDFLAKPDDDTEVSSYIYDEIERQLLSHYDIDIYKDNIARGALHTELVRYKESTAGKAALSNPEKYGGLEVEYILMQQRDRHGYIGKVFRHLVLGRECSVAMFLDNLDRRNDSIQEVAFLKASSVARDWSCLVFVCLRPGTFYRSKAFGVLDTVSPVLIDVVSPKTSKLLSRRLRYARTLAEGVNLPLNRQQPTNYDAAMSFVLPNVAKFLECCARSFEMERPLCELFDAVSNGNAREMLVHVYNVLTSQHLNTEKILDKLSAGGYRLADFEALRALLFGDSFHFDPSKCPFINLFDIERADPIEHFSRYIALHFLLAVREGHPTYGYAPLESIVRYLGQIGYTQEHVAATIRFLFEKTYCESKNPVDVWCDDIDKLKITAKGKYHIARLVNTFVYMDAVSIDTPIIDSADRSLIHDEFEIRDRLARCERFMEYLSRCASTIQDGGFHSHWLTTRESLQKEIETVSKKIHRAYRS